MTDSEKILILKDFIYGEWVDCDKVQEALSIDFATGLKMFDFSRTAEWNPYPLNGQKITIKFRLKSPDEAVKEFAERLKADIVETGDEHGLGNRYPVLTYNYIDNLLKEMVGGE